MSSFAESVLNFALSLFLLWIAIWSFNHMKEFRVKLRTEVKRREAIKNMDVKKQEVWGTPDGLNEPEPIYSPLREVTK